MQGGWVYVMTNKPHGALYVGITANLAARTLQHRSGGGAKFCKAYNLTRLVYAERHERIEDAITREKSMKAWKRVWKLRLIHEQNPDWVDLFDQLNA